MNPVESREMHPVESRELSIGELETVSGGMTGYHYCWYGRGGAGLYPGYIACGDGGSLGGSILSGAIGGAADGL